jgi:hypothetical protein
MASLAKRGLVAANSAVPERRMMKVRAVMGRVSNDGTSQTLLVDANENLISHLFSERFLEFKLDALTP